ncbi:MAG: hypothetical protein AAFR58_23000 [Cyanobacteria bacterium J06627_28]
MPDLLYRNDLSLSPTAKVIPYAGDRIGTTAQQRPSVVNAPTNYGFRNLKIKPSLIDTVPELSGDSSLKALVSAINRPETCFFTVGCHSQLMMTDEGNYRQGYLEFAWNCQGCVQDAINYFALYFHFNKFLRVRSFNQPIAFKWIIQEASFSDAEIDGFSCAIQMQTRSLSSVEQAEMTWQFSLRMIGAYFNTVFTEADKPIYKPL